MASVIDVLKFVFQADTAKAEADVKKLDDVIEDVEKQADKTADAIDDMNKELKDTKKSAATGKDALLGFAKGALTVVASMATVGAAISGAMSRAKDLSELDTAAKNMGSSTADVDLFRRSVEAMGGSAETAVDQMRNLSVSIGEALVEGEGGKADVFKKLGISLKDASGQARSTMDVMSDLSGVLEGMDQQQGRAIVNQLGISDPKTVDLMLKGRNEMNALMETQKKYGYLSKEQIANADKLNKANTQLRMRFNALGASLFDKMIPALEWVLNKGSGLLDFIMENKVAVGVFAGVLASAFIPTLVTATVVALKFVGSMLLAALPFILLAAVIALAVDEIYTFLQGGETLGSKFAPYLLDAFDNVINGLKKLKDDFFLWLGDMIDLAAEKAPEIAKELLKMVPGGKLGMWAYDKITGADENPANSATSGTISNQNSSVNQTSSVNIGEVTVNTAATDAKGVAGALRGELSNTAQQLSTESANGVVA